MRVCLLARKCVHFNAELFTTRWSLTLKCFVSVIMPYTPTGGGGIFRCGLLFFSFTSFAFFLSCITTALLARQYSLLPIDKRSDSIWDHPPSTIIGIYFTRRTSGENNVPFVIDAHIVITSIVYREMCVRRILSQQLWITYHHDCYDYYLMCNSL